MGEVEPKNPKFAIAIAYVNGDGEVVRFLRPDGTDYIDNDYYLPEEKKRIPGSAVLITPNNCRWRLIDGKWKCV